MSVQPSAITGLTAGSCLRKDFAFSVADGDKPASIRGNRLGEPPLRLQLLPQRELLHHERRDHLVGRKGSGGVAGGHGRLSR